MAKSQKDDPSEREPDRLRREYAIQTKIAGTLGNKKGTSIYEIMMTLCVI